MQPCLRYSLRLTRAGRLQSELLRDGSRTSLQVDGVLLEAQFEQDDGSVLLLLTEDSPYDELLHLYLMNPAGVVIDALEAGDRDGLVCTGLLKLRRHGLNWLELDFLLGAPSCRVELQSQPRVRLRVPQGWRYKQRLCKHRLAVTELTSAMKAS